MWDKFKRYKDRQQTSLSLIHLFTHSFNCLLLLPGGSSIISFMGILSELFYANQVTPPPHIDIFFLSLSYINSSIPICTPFCSFFFNLVIFLGSDVISVFKELRFLGILAQNFILHKYLSFKKISTNYYESFLFVCYKQCCDGEPWTYVISNMYDFYNQ